MMPLNDERSLFLRPEAFYTKGFTTVVKNLDWGVDQIRGGLSVIYYYALMHLAGIADRHGWMRLADWLRDRIPMPRIEKGCSALLRTDFRFIVTEGGGCAVDIDNEPDFDAARELYERWRTRQLARVEARYGMLPLAHTAGGDRR